MADSEPACASDLVLDQLLGDELSVERAAEVRRHLEACAACRTRFEELERFRDQARLPEFERLVPAAARPSRRARWYAVGAATFAAAAALMLWMRATSVPPEGEETGEVTRLKGKGSLGFYVKRGDSVTRGGPGEVLHPGDAVEFAYTAPSDGYLAVLSLDGAGHASVYFPEAPRAAPFAAGEHVMPGSTLLDDVLGAETFYGVFCDAAIEIEPLRARLQRDPRTPLAEPGCRIDTIAVEKR